MKLLSNKLLLVVACSIFFFFGLFHASLGPLLGELAEQTGSGLAAIGGVLTFLFLGALLAQLVTGPLFDRFGNRHLLFFSLLVLGGSIFAFTFVRSLGWLFFLFLLAGMGQGGVDMGVNLVVADAYPEKNTRYLNLIHFFFGMGALTGPALVGVSIQELNRGLPVQWLAAGGMLLLALGVFWVLRNQPRATASTATHTGQKEAIGFRVYASPLLWLMGAVMLIYIGVEYGLGSWVSSFMALTAGVSARDGALLTSLYWGALALGRLAGLGLSKRLTRLQLLLLALGGSLVGAVCLGLLHTRLVPSILCLVWISFSYGTVIPTTIALASATFPQDKGKVVSVLSAMGSIGGTILPWAVGIFLGRDQVAGYLAFILAAIAVLLALVLAIRHLLSQHPSRM